MAEQRKSLNLLSCFLFWLSPTLLLFTLHSFAQTPTVHPWPEEVLSYFNQTLPSAFNNLGQEGYNTLFNSVGDLELFGFGDTTSNVYAASNRAIYDNQDVLNTWTVVDKLVLDLNKSIPIFYAPLGVGLPAISLNLGGEATLQFLNIRRSDSKHKLPPVIEKPAIPLLEEDQSHWYDLDGRGKAEFSDILKRFTIPFRIPFSPHGLHRLDSGEIMSFDLTGYLSFSATLGETISAGNSLPKLEAGVNGSVYVKAHWRYSLMKEDERFARIKITHAKKAGGYTLGYGAHFDDITLYEGFSINSNLTGLFEQTATITPFRFQLTHEDEDLFDRCFRYDLNSLEAQHAYSLAMRGQLKESEDLAQAHEGEPEPPVQKLFTRHEQLKTTAKQRGVGLWLIFRKEDDRIVTNVDAVITRAEDGTSHLVRSVANNLHEWSTGIGQFEKFRYQFSFFMNETRYYQTDDHGQSYPDSMSLMAEGFIEDNVTSGKELNHYSETFETLAGVDHAVFPRLPIHPPPELDDECNQPKRRFDLSCILHKLTPRNFLAYYGRTSMYLRLGFNRPMLEKFINTPKENMWPILAAAFHVPLEKWDSPGKRTLYSALHLYTRIANAPLYLGNGFLRRGPDLDVAHRFHRMWLDIQDETNLTKRIELLGKLFQTVNYGEELIKVLRLSQEDAPIQYALVGTNRMFTTQVREEKWGNTVTDYLSQLSLKEMDFENTQSSVILDDTAKVSDFNTQILEVASSPSPQPPLIRARLDFNLSIKPNYLYFKVVTDNKWGLSKKAGEILIANTTPFDIGPNSIELSSLDDRGLGKELLGKLKVGHFYKIIMSISKDGKTWGPVATKEFRCPTPF